MKKGRKLSPPPRASHLHPESPSYPTLLTPAPLRLLIPAKKVKGQLTLSLSNTLAA